MSINTEANLRALLADVDRQPGERRVLAVHRSLTYTKDGSTASGWWAIEDGHMQGTLRALDGSRFHGTVDARTGFDGTLDMNGAGCSWLFCSHAAFACCDVCHEGGWCVGPPGGAYAQVASMQGRWDRFGTGAGVITLVDGTSIHAAWRDWFSLVDPLSP